MTRILLVEDDEMNRDMLSRRLRRRGYEVVGAGDGRAAVDIAKFQSPDLILMDLSLPEMDGWEAARIIKGEPATSCIPIIALTAHVMADDRRLAMEAGCDDYDTKPVQMQRLVGKIEAWLESSNSTALCPA